MKDKVGFIVKGLILAYLITGIFLLGIALLLYKLNLGEGIVNILIIVSYVVASFVAGMYIGKKIGHKKYLWGLFIGACYFFLLVLMTFITNGKIQTEEGSFLTTMILTLAGSMLGGMSSKST